MLDDVPAFRLEQNEREMVVFSIAASKLIPISYYSPRELDPETGIQRPFNLQRSREIAEYIDSDDSVLPNNIIVNLRLDRLNLQLGDVYDNDRHTLHLGRIVERQTEVGGPLGERVAFVIDGQHRLRAFEYTRKKDFLLIVTALINLSLAEVADIFVRINYYQKTVNTSLVLDLLGIKPSIFPGYYMLHNVVKRLNEDAKSPFYGKIRMLGVGRGFISQASLIDAIDKYKVEKCLKETGLPIDPREPSAEGVLYNALWNFYTAASQVFASHWGEGQFLTKTVGIRALMKLMVYTLQRFHREKREFSVREIAAFLGRIDQKVLDAPTTAGLGGEKGVKMLYEQLVSQFVGGAR